MEVLHGPKHIRHVAFNSDEAFGRSEEQQLSVFKGVTVVRFLSLFEDVFQTNLQLLVTCSTPGRLHLWVWRPWRSHCHGRWSQEDWGGPRDQRCSKLVLGGGCDIKHTAGIDKLIAMPMNISIAFHCNVLVSCESCFLSYQILDSLGSHRAPFARWFLPGMKANPGTTSRSPTRPSRCQSSCSQTSWRFHICFCFLLGRQGG